MNNSFDYMSQIEHKSGYLFVVLVDLDDRYLIAHPKYNKQSGNKKRISNPVDPNRNNQILIEGAMPIGSKDYLLLKSDVIQYYPCFNIFRNLKVGTSSSETTRKTAYSLMEKLSPMVPMERIGITGSLATGCAVDGYSDIDILLQEADFRIVKNSDLMKSQDFKFRTIEQWIEFYEHYGVFSALCAEDFAKAAIEKKQQFIYQGIPVSIFIDGGDTILKITNSLARNNGYTMSIIKGEVLSENLTNLPGYMIVRSENKVMVIINYHRSYQECLRVGDRFIAFGLSCSFSDLYLVLYDDECYIKRCAGD